MLTCDFLVVGAGIAGASAAAELAAHGTVVLAERERQPGYHTTGRSAALFTETYGPPAIRALTAASRAFLAVPPDGFAAPPLLTPRGLLFIGGPEQRAALDRDLAEGCRAVGTVRAVSADEAVAMVPVLRREVLAGGVFEPDAMDIDVHALHQGYLRLLRARGGTLLTDAEVVGLERRGGGWQVETAAGPVAAAAIVNAAGAWADEIGRLAGAAPVGLVPKRRTAILFDPAEPVAMAGWPFVADVDMAFYFKPEAGRVLASPADETPMPPCDVQPDELDIAVTVDRIERATTFAVRRIASRWAGLRSFVADGLPVVGWDETAAGVFWLAGQGGYGIQTAPALARAAAALAAGRGLPADIEDRGVTAAMLSPRRLRRAPS